MVLIIMKFVFTAYSKFIPCNLTKANLEIRLSWKLKINYR